MLTGNLSMLNFENDFANPLKTPCFKNTDNEGNGTNSSMYTSQIWNNYVDGEPKSNSKQFEAQQYQYEKSNNLGFGSNHNKKKDYPDPKNILSTYALQSNQINKDSDPNIKLIEPTQIYVQKKRHQQIGKNSPLDKKSPKKNNSTISSFATNISTDASFVAAPPNLAEMTQVWDLNTLSSLEDKNLSYYKSQSTYAKARSPENKNNTIKSSYKIENAESPKKIFELKKNIDSLQFEKLNLTKKIQELEINEKKIQTQLLALDKDQSKLDKVKKEYQSQIEALKKRIQQEIQLKDSYKKESQELFISKERLQKQVSDLHKKVEFLEIEKKNLKNNLETLESKLNNTIDYSKNYEEQKILLKKLDATCKEHLENLARVQQEANELREANSKLAYQHNELKGYSIEIYKLFDDAQIAISNLEQKNKNSSKKVPEFGPSMPQPFQHSCEVSATNNQPKAKDAQSTKNFISKESSLNQEIKKLDAEIKKLLEENHNWQQYNIEFEQDYKILNESLLNEQKNNQELKKENFLYIKQINELKMELVNLANQQGKIKDKENAKLFLHKNSNASQHDIVDKRAITNNGKPFNNAKQDQFSSEIVQLQNIIMEKDAVILKKNTELENFKQKFAQLNRPQVNSNGTITNFTNQFPSINESVKINFTNMKNYTVNTLQSLETDSTAFQAIQKKIENQNITLEHETFLYKENNYKRINLMVGSFKKLSEAEYVIFLSVENNTNLDFSDISVELFKNHEDELNRKNPIVKSGIKKIYIGEKLEVKLTAEIDWASPVLFANIFKQSNNNCAPLSNLCNIVFINSN